MSNETQLERYKKLLTHIDEFSMEDLDIEKVESICHYSYRNINRIFKAIHNETIGQYVKRLRMERAAQYLKYTEMGVSDIAFQVGFEDRAAFSKAFKKRYGLAPSEFRNDTEAKLEVLQESLLLERGSNGKKLEYTIEYLPQFESLFLEYRGSYTDDKAIEKAWNELIHFADKHNLINNQSIIFTEIIDDVEISDDIHSRYYFSILLDKAFIVPKGKLYRTKTHAQQKYAKFVFTGTDQESAEFYQEIYAFWMTEVNLELTDLPILEFYPNYHEDLPKDQLITEIYIPVK